MANGTDATGINFTGIRNWILGTIGVTLVSGGTAWMTSVNGQLRDHGERMAVQESQMRDVRAGIHEINQKLDKVLDKK